MSIYLKIPGITGNVQAQGYEGWIELHHADFAGVANSVRMDVGKAVDRSSSRLAFGQLSALKSQDKSSVKIFEAVHKNEVFPTIEMHYVNTGDKLSTYSKVKLTNAAFTHYSERFNAETGRPDEVIRLAYTQMERTTIPRDANNNLGSPMISGFDLEKSKAL